MSHFNLTFDSLDMVLNVFCLRAARSKERRTLIVSAMESFVAEIKVTTHTGK